jgi:glycogen debranching enzyme
MLALPAAVGATSSSLHPHKWFGASMYGRKYFEGQFVRARGVRSHSLSAAVQTGLTISLTNATRHYEVEGIKCNEQFFVPDGIDGFVCRLDGDLDFIVEPHFDMRLALALSKGQEHYTVESIANGVVVSNTLPTGKFNDLRETYEDDGQNEDAPRIFAAVQVVARNGLCNIRNKQSRQHKVRFERDQKRAELLLEHTEDKCDHAPLWRFSQSTVFAPVTLQFHGAGTIVYGFGSSKEEALSNLEQLRERLKELEAKKHQQAKDLLANANFWTGNSEVDTAWGLVLTRVIDCLVAKDAQIPGAAFSKPTTMILAGNQYFQDSWKRDENIALGTLLELGMFDLAREVIRDTWQMQDEKTGRLPQRIRSGETPAYHSSDGTLWALIRLHQYARLTGDNQVLAEKMSMVVHFFKRSLERTTWGLLPSGSAYSPDKPWETWMDTEYSPRDGFPVEIQILWIACLRAFLPEIEHVNSDLAFSMSEALTAAEGSLGRFNVRGMPVDSLDDTGVARDLITPNAYFCFGLGIDLGADVDAVMRQIGLTKLRGAQGIVTLSPDDWHKVYPDFAHNDRFVQGKRQRSAGKFNYHRGIEWNWLNQFFAAAELKYDNADGAYENYLQPLVKATLQSGGVGGISELFDLDGPRGPDFQTWSMVGLLAALQSFAGVDIDVPNKRIHIRPQIPSAWPELNLRKWFSAVPFDLHFKRSANGSTLTIHFPEGMPSGIEVTVDAQALGSGCEVQVS